MEINFKEHFQTIVENKENIIIKMEIIIKVVGNVISNKDMED
jgi:hypothetical protein